MKNLFKLLFVVFCSTLIIIPSIGFGLSNSKPAEDFIYKSVVFIKVPARDKTGQVADNYCNATLISPSELVSAAHCFLKSELPKGQPFQIELGEYKYVERNGQTIRIGYITKQKFSATGKFYFLNGLSPEASSVSPDLDIGKVIIDQPLPLEENFPYAKLYPQKLPQLTLQNQIQVVTINFLETVSSIDTKQVAYLNQINQTNYYLKSTSLSRVAPGDSGGAVFATINNQLYLIGVVKGRAETFFNNWDVYALHQNRF